jgi:hypothetical protein
VSLVIDAGGYVPPPSDAGHNPELEWYIPSAPCTHFIHYESRGSSVCTAVWLLDDCDSIACTGGLLVDGVPHKFCGLPNLLSKLYRGSSPEHEANHSPPKSAAFKNTRSYTITLFMGFQVKLSSSLQEVIIFNRTYLNHGRGRYE